MTVRTFTMPTSLNESIANSQPLFTDTGHSNTEQSYTPSQKEPLAHHGPKHQPGITFAAQDKLAKLPIPELESTLKKYQDCLKPLQNSGEQEDTAAAVQEFLQGEGPELQARLKKYSQGKTSYIEQFCTFTMFILDYKIRSAYREIRVRFVPELRQPCGSQFESLLPP